MEEEDTTNLLRRASRGCANLQKSSFHDVIKSSGLSSSRMTSLILCWTVVSSSKKKCENTTNQLIEREIQDYDVINRSNWVEDKRLNKINKFDGWANVERLFWNNENLFRTKNFIQK